MSSWWNESSWSRSARASARLASEPVERSSTTSTAWPSASSRSTRVEPMNPAPPVTSARISPASAPGTSGALEPGPRRGSCHSPTADHRQVRGQASSPTTAPLADERGLDAPPRAHHGARQEHRVGDPAPACTRAPELTTERATWAPRSTNAAWPTKAGPSTSPSTTLAPRVQTRPSRMQRAPADRGPGPAARDEVELDPEVLRRRAGVGPVGVGPEGEQRAVVGHGRELSRSIDTGRPSGIRSSTDGSST